MTLPEQFDAPTKPVSESDIFLFLLLVFAVIFVYRSKSVWWMKGPLAIVLAASCVIAYNGISSAWFVIVPLAIYMGLALRAEEFDDL